jgi:hypothetical protein
MATVFIRKDARNRRFAVGRPRWENLLLVASLAVFWSCVMLKLMG